MTARILTHLITAIFLLLFTYPTASVHAQKHAAPSNTGRMVVIEVNENRIEIPDAHLIHFTEQGGIKIIAPNFDASKLLNEDSIADYELTIRRLKNQVEALNKYAQWENERESVIFNLQMTWYSLGIIVALALIAGVHATWRLFHSAPRDPDAIRRLYSFYNKLDNYLRVLWLPVLLVLITPQIVLVAILIQDLSISDAIERGKPMWPFVAQTFAICAAYLATFRYCHQKIIELEVQTKNKKPNRR